MAKMPYDLRRIGNLDLETKVIDETDRRLLEVLRHDARLSLKDLAEQVGLSSPSVAERMRRLQERGVIRGFTVEIDPAALGFVLQAIVRIRPLPGKLHIVRKLIQETPQIVECDTVTGDDCFIAKMFVRSMQEIDGILDRISDKASTSTSMVKSHTVTRRMPPLD
jgi:Lrp/AsnC family transcriptional regulator, leucine-responsive regulatory protein